jgi:hypothetical protein
MPAINSIDQVIAFGSDAIRWLFTWSWQALLLLGAAWVALRLDRSRSAAVRYKVWLIAVVAVAALPLLGALSQSLRLPAVITAPSFPLGYPDGVVAGVGTGEAAPRAFSWTSLAWLLLCGGWAAGVTFSFFRLGNSLWHLAGFARPRAPSRSQTWGARIPTCSHRAPVPCRLSYPRRSKPPGLRGYYAPSCCFRPT